jgi:DNA (cytosine-5)-methyltransferase 1
MIGADLFSGAGGLTLGAKQAGIKVVFAVEADHHAAKTYVANHPEVQLFEDDIRKLRRIPFQKNGDVTILFGGPPCQGFSTSNQRTRNEANANNWMFKEFVRLARSWRPDWILYENVKGIRETERGYFFHLVLKEFEALGYTLSFAILNAVNFGVPQRRERLFVVGSLHRIKVKLPVGRFRPVTVWHAISDLPVLRNGADTEVLPYKKPAVTQYAMNLRGSLIQASGHLVTKNAPYVVQRYAYVPQGGNWEDIPPRLLRNYKDRRGCHTGIYHRLLAHASSVVIGNYRKNMLIHPYEDRGLSVREAARLQSFPDSYKFKGSIGFQQQQVGNAVPPLLAKAVFETVGNIKM